MKASLRETEISLSALPSQKGSLKKKKPLKYFIFLMKIVYILARVGEQPNVFHIYMDYLHIESKVALDSYLQTLGNINQMGTAMPEAKD